MKYQGIAELINALQSKKISAAELCRHYHDRVQKHDTTLNSVTHIARTSSMMRAKEIDEARANGEPLQALAGIPLLVKENFCTVDMPTTCASKALQGYQSPFDATIIKNCRRAGMVMLGKCNLPWADRMRTAPLAQLKTHGNQPMYLEDPQEEVLLQSPRDYRQLLPVPIPVVQSDSQQRFAV